MYKVLQRPHTAPQHVEPAKITYSDESDNSVGGDSDSDSDCGKTKTKRPKIKIRRGETEARAKTNDKYKVWCTQVQEESLTEELVSCGVTRSKFSDRSVESYDLSLAFSLEREHRNDNSYDRRERTTNKRSFSDRSNIKLRLGKRQSPDNSNDHQGPERTVPNLTTTVESTNEQVAADIADKLDEKKDTLISTKCLILVFF